MYFCRGRFIPYFIKKGGHYSNGRCQLNKSNKHTGDLEIICPSVPLHIPLNTSQMRGKGDGGAGGGGSGGEGVSDTRLGAHQKIIHQDKQICRN